MSLVDPERIRPLQDNLLVRLDMHANAQSEERKIGSIIVPKTADDGANAIHGEAVPAVIVAAGPGRWTDSFRDQEKGTVPYGDGYWLPMNPLLKPGARVLVDSPDQGDKVFSRDKAAQYRLVREENIVMLMGDEPVPLGDAIIVAPDKSEQTTESGLYLAQSGKDRPTEGEVLAVGPGKRIPSTKALTAMICAYRELPFKEGDRVIYGKFAGIPVRLEGHELLLLREESVLAVVTT
jgi:chaperonin GroES